ncbi:MAG: 30S ribosomal protein S8 [Bacteroidota bacterium]
MMTDPVADYLTRVRNASQARHKKVDIPASKLKREVTKILRENRYITDYTDVTDDKQGILRIFLKYNEDQPAIYGLKRISKPGIRVYAGVDELPRVLNGLGIAIISTSRGLMTDKRARKERVGGEVLCYVW